MLAHFEQYIASQINLDKEHLAQISALAIPRKLRRRQIILHEGEVCRHKIFVVKGLLRIYRAAADGNEYIMRFAAENTWMIDPESYNNQIPSKYIFEALE
ncbi:MAG: cyclic nucleotide-binding domain-containing protein, partial [Sphingobacteriales bacterium]